MKVRERLHAVNDVIQASIPFCTTAYIMIFVFNEIIINRTICCDIVTDSD